MCEVGAACPNCGQPDLDADELSCIAVDTWLTRVYRCRQCAAQVVVRVPLPSSRPAGRIWADALERAAPAVGAAIADMFRGAAVRADAAAVEPAPAIYEDGWRG